MTKDLKWEELPCETARDVVVEGEDVAVILGYYNGNRFLEEQIRSIAEQTHQPTIVYIADDGSKSPVDRQTIRLLGKKGIRTRLGVQPFNKGYNENFLSALSAASKQHDYYAFSDQDDIWHTDKLERALGFLRNCPTDQPALYCTRTAIADEKGKAELGLSPLFQKPPHFTHALVQNIAGGNTMVFNRAAARLVNEASAGCEVVSYDWWCYQIISGAGGLVHYDPEPSLRYRQHSYNVVGSNNGWLARGKRMLGLINGQYRRWNAINLGALKHSHARLTLENQRSLDQFTQARTSWLPRRISLFRQSGVHRQGRLQNLALIVALVLNRV